MVALSPLQSRFLALALLVAVGGAVITAIAPLWERYTDNAGSIEQLREHIFRYDRLAASSEVSRRQLRRWEKDDQVAQYALPAESPDLAAARLQERVKTVVKQTGGTLLSTQNLSPMDDGLFQRITVNVKMRGSIEALSETLYSIESGVPLLFIDNVVVINRSVRKSRRRRKTQNQGLEIRFDLSGYLHAAER